MKLADSPIMVFDVEATELMAPREGR